MTTNSSSIRKLSAAVLAAGVVVFALNSLRLIFQSVELPAAFRKDFFQDYLMARALRRGLDPYASIQTLSTALVPENPFPVFNHPSPHMPAGLLLLWPLGYTDYRTAMLLWICLQFAALAGAVYLLCCACFPLYQRYAGSPFRSKKAFAAVVLTAAVASIPVCHDMILGQFSIILLLCMAGMLAAVSAERSFAAGALLGVALALKGFGWILLPYYWIRGERKLALAALGSALAIVAASLLFLSPEQLLRYFGQIAPQHTALYAAVERNISIWTFGQRLLAGLAPGPIEGLAVAPLINLPKLAQPVSLLFVVSITGLALLRSARLSVVGGAAQLVALSIVLSPIAWEHYLVLLLAPLAVVFAQAGEKKWTRTEQTLLVFITAMFFIGDFLRQAVLDSYADSHSAGFAAGQISLIFVAQVFAVVWLLGRAARNGEVFRGT